MNKIFFILIISVTVINCYSQNNYEKENNLCLNLKLDNRYESFLIGLDNPIDIVYAQDKEISKENISVSFEHYKTKEKRELEIFEKNGQLYIRPDSLGRVTIKVETKDGIKEKIVNTKTLTAVGKLSRYRANHSGKLNKGEFRVQMGIQAAIEGYDIDARCATLNYEVIRMSSEGIAKRRINQGSKFDSDSRKLISEAESGDLYIFRNILYKCPGDDFEKRLSDMTFEIE